MDEAKLDPSSAHRTPGCVFLCETATRRHLWLTYGIIQHSFQISITVMSKEPSYHVMRSKRVDEEWSDGEAESVEALLLSEDPNYVPRGGRIRRSSRLRVIFNTCSWALNVVLLIVIFSTWKRSAATSTSYLCPSRSICKLQFGKLCRCLAWSEGADLREHSSS